MPLDGFDWITSSEHSKEIMLERVAGIEPVSYSLEGWLATIASPACYRLSGMSGGVTFARRTSWLQP